jgi:hypothetical protein
LNLSAAMTVSALVLLVLAVVAPVSAVEAAWLAESSLLAAPARAKR